MCIRDRVLAVLVPSVLLVAVIAQEPGVLKVILKVLVPETKAAFTGNIAAPSVVSIAIVFPGALDTTFQKASTAFTVTVNELTVVCPVGVPVFPLPVPGAAVSPGNSICNLANAPGLTVMSPTA